MKSLNEILVNKSSDRTLMVIFPHPDDESMVTGGLLLVAKKQGWKTIVVTLTNGEAGKMHIHPNGRSTREVRLHELRKATKILNVDELIVRDFGDAKLKGQEKKLEIVIEKIMIEHQPRVVVTYDYSGLTGHPDHITVSRVVKKVVGLDKGIRLFWVVLPDKIRKIWKKEKLTETMSEPNYQLDLGFKTLWQKYLAIKQHASQKFVRGLFMPLSLLLLLMRKEWYHEVELQKAYPYKYSDFEI